MSRTREEKKINNTIMKVTTNYSENDNNIKILN